MKAGAEPASSEALVHEVLKRARPLDAFFSPRAVAVIGASDTEGSVGRTVLRNLVQGASTITGGFSGTVYPVNPRREQVMGMACYPSVKAIEGPVDLAVIVTPARTVPDLITECGEAGVSAVIVISAGFRETGPEGAAMEREIKARADAAGIRIIGPNCLGIMRPSFGLNATFAADMARPGRVALLTQSGALFTAILDWSLGEQLGFSIAVSVGSMADTGWGDLIDYLGDDPETEAILLYMESVGDVRSFVSAAREVSLAKPIIVIKPGRTEEAAQAAASHTGALTGADDVLDAALHRVGVLRVQTISELFSMAEVLGRQPLPAGPRLALVTNAGGPGVLATDALITSGGKLAELSKATIDALDEVLPGAWSRGNPVDVLGDAGPERYARALEIVLDDPGTDGMLVILTPQDMTDPTRTAAELREVAARARAAGKPVLASWMGGQTVQAGEDILNEAQVATFRYPDAAASAFCAMWRYARDLQVLYETPGRTGTKGIDAAAARALVERVRASGRTLLDEHESKALLAHYGLPVVPTHTATSAEEALEAARAIGFPVVLKLWSHTLTHKSDVGGVRLNLPDEEAVTEAFEGIRRSVTEKAGAEHFAGVTVQPMVSRGDAFEVILGSVQDPQFGPVILFGAGGTLVEVMGDSALGLPPLTTISARRLMERTRIFTALKGVRGRPPVDLARLDELLVRFAQVPVDLPEIQEIEINPLWADDQGAIALDARVVLHPPEVDAQALPQPAIRPYPSQYVREVQSRDGVSLQIRPIRPDDEPRFVELHRQLSAHSVQQRYLRSVAFDERTTRARVIRICFPDYDRELPLVVEHRGEQGPELVAVGRLTRRPGGSEATFSLLVRDDWHGRGVGTALLQGLIDAAQGEDLTRIIGHMHRKNTQMQRLAERLGFHLGAPDEEGILRAERQFR